jgi:hypothetical protein
MLQDPNVEMYIEIAVKLYNVPHITEVADFEKQMLNIKINLI